MQDKKSDKGKKSGLPAPPASVDPTSIRRAPRVSKYDAFVARARKVSAGKLASMKLKSASAAATVRTCLIRTGRIDERYVCFNRDAVIYLGFDDGKGIEAFKKYSRGVLKKRKGTP